MVLGEGGVVCGQLEQRYQRLQITNVLEAWGQFYVNLLCQCQLLINVKHISINSSILRKEATSPLTPRYKVTRIVKVCREIIQNLKATIYLVSDKQYKLKN